MSVPWVTVKFGYKKIIQWNTVISRSIFHHRNGINRGNKKKCGRSGCEAVIRLLLFFYIGISLEAGNSSSSRIHLPERPFGFPGYTHLHRSLSVTHIQREFLPNSVHTNFPNPSPDDSLNSLETMENSHLCETPHKHFQNCFLEYFSGRLFCSTWSDPFVLYVFWSVP